MSKKQSNDLDTNLPQIHPRELPCREASNELRAFLLGWRSRHELTSAEYVALLTDEAASFGRRMVAMERR